MSQVPRDVNHIQLQIFFKERLQKLGILAFEVKKLRAQQSGYHFAIITVANISNGNNFLQYYGSRGSRQPPLLSLVFQGETLRFQKSNRSGQPAPLTIRTLQEKEDVMRAKLGSRVLSSLPLHSSRSTLSFQTLMTGVWEYGRDGELIFDQKSEDVRQGYVTFGGTAMVIYLQQSGKAGSSWHGRIDIPYAILEHVIPSVDLAQRGALTFTLKSPPKFYNIRSTDDLHLYAGEQAPVSSGQPPDIASLSLKPITKTHRLERLCSLGSSHTPHPALCMVYRVVYPDIRTAQYAYNHIKDFSVPDTYCWRTLSHTSLTNKIDTEYAVIEKKLCSYGPYIPDEFNFAVRFQLMALMLEGTITPRKMIDLIPCVQEFAASQGAERTKSAIRHLRRQIPTPAPQIGASQFNLKTFVGLLEDSVKESEGRKAAGQDLDEKQRRHHHLALTYKATITPTGKC